MLGQPMSMLIPQVLGFRLHGELPEGTTATDLVLTVTQMLRERGVVGMFVEFYGAGLVGLPIADRATIGNMSPEFGSTCAIFPIDAETLTYLELSGRPPEQIALVEAYAKEQGLWHDESTEEPTFSDTIELDLGTVEPSLAGPKRPQDRVSLSDAKSAFRLALLDYVPSDGEQADPQDEAIAESYPASDPPANGSPGHPQPLSAGAEHAGAHASATLERCRAATPVTLDGESFELDHGHVVIAAITSCTNTSNPSVMIGAGILARNALARGLRSKPWVKTSLAPGSKVVTEYLDRAGLTEPLEALGFNLVGYGCTTCIGNSGPLPEEISAAVGDANLAVVSVLSGNRNFEGRIHSDVKMNYLASPPLCVAYALAGTMDIDIVGDPLGQDEHGEDVYLRDIWPSVHEVAQTVGEAVRADMFRHSYGEVFAGDERWKGLPVPAGERFAWDERSTYVRLPPYFQGMPAEPGPVERHRGRARAGAARRQRHHRPHLTRGRDQARWARRLLPAGAGGRAAGLQHLRRAPRQPRGDDARDVREHPSAQPARRPRRGRTGRASRRRLHALSRRRLERADVDLRRRHALPAGGHRPRGAGGP